jgi:hypothetical protein
MYKYSVLFSATVDDLFGDADDISSDEEAKKDLGKKDDDREGDDEEGRTQVIETDYIVKICTQTKTVLH